MRRWKRYLLALILFFGRGHSGNPAGRSGVVVTTLDGCWWDSYKTK